MYHTTERGKRQSPPVYGLDYLRLMRDWRGGGA